MFKELISTTGKILDKNNIPYMIIGGQAVLLYGEPRMTKDIDITLGADTEKLPHLLDIIKKIPLKPLPENTMAFVHKTMVLPALHNKTGIRVDFIFSFSPYEREAIKHGKKVKLNGVNINFASVEDVIIHKIIADRERDREDIRTIVLKNPDINKNYIIKWLREFDKPFPEKHFIDKFNAVMK
ncbi:MAG: nucleotidyltransferase [Spirochaetes bacterium]|nr:nucleotidyltransferase [Spirochaetota bacterium]